VISGDRIPVAVLFATSALIWGSTWLAITFQLGQVAPEVSVAYRFLLAALVLAAFCTWRGGSLRFNARVHALLALQGMLMFGLNYVAVYRAEQYVTSGLVAVLFSVIVFTSLIGTRIAFRTPMTRRALAGATLGVGGVTLLFLPEVRSAAERADALTGIAFGIAATVLATGGNLVTMRMQRAELPVLETTAIGMAYGALTAALVAIMIGAPWTFEWTLAYVGSLAYLALFGSVIAFGAYLTVLKRIGAGPSSYTAVLTPVLAMLLSSLVEGYRWSAAGVLGIALAIAGNVLVLRGRK
jgi:drug/metabolite transporter (DMT)-like permease